MGGLFSSIMLFREFLVSIFFITQFLSCVHSAYQLGVLRSAAVTWSAALAPCPPLSVTPPTLRGYDWSMLNYQ